MNTFIDLVWLLILQLNCPLMIQSPFQSENRIKVKWNHYNKHKNMALFTAVFPTTSYIFDLQCKAPSSVQVPSSVQAPSSLRFSVLGGFWWTSLTCFPDVLCGLTSIWEFLQVFQISLHSTLLHFILAPLCENRSNNHGRLLISFSVL